MKENFNNGQKGVFVSGIKYPYLLLSVWSSASIQLDTVRLL